MRVATHGTLSWNLKSAEIDRVKSKTLWAGGMGRVPFFNATELISILPAVGVSSRRITQTQETVVEERCDDRGLS